jgi:GlpG protein
MRQIVTLTDGVAARAFADYLLTLSIETRLDEEPEGWVVWVCDEDRVPQARAELEAFTRDPSDPRYRAAAPTATALRREEARLEDDYRRKQVSVRDRWAPLRESAPLTFTFLIVSVTVALASRLGEQPQPVLQALHIASYQKEGNWIRWNYLEDIRHGQVWRLVTPIFIHFGLLHLVFNMYMLFVLGGAFEYRRGSLRFLLFVLVVAITSNLAQYYLGGTSLDNLRQGVLVPNPRFGGMSGVLYGLFGYIWMKSIHEPARGLVISQQSVVILIGWFFLCWTGLIGPIANIAHTVGLIDGLIIGYAPFLWRRLWKR